MLTNQLTVMIVGDRLRESTAFEFCWREDAPIPEDYFPTVIDECTRTVRVGDHEVMVELWTWSANEDAKSFRVQSYVGTDVFLLLFSYEDVNTLESIRSKWVPEISQSVGKGPVLVLVGVRGNVRENYQEHEARGESPFGESPVKDEMIKKVMRKIGADCFMECCPRINYNIQETMTKAVEIYLKKNSKERKKKKK